MFLLYNWEELNGRQVDRGAAALVNLPFHRLFDFAYYLRTRYMEDRERALIDHECSLDRVDYWEYMQSQAEGKKSKDMAAIALSEGEIG
jgi:hypothetical protein